MRLRSPSIFLVCLLAFTTLWLSETVASHIHLDSENLGCEAFHHANGTDVALHSGTSSFELAPVATFSIVATGIAPYTRPVAPRNSRAPPSLG